MKLKHVAWAWIIGSLVGIYTAFVATSMWNWFAVRALRVPTISFLEMVGLVWLIDLLIDRTDNDEFRWKAVNAVIDVCVPDHKREMLAETLKQLEDDVWIDTASTVFGKIIGNTAILILGFGLHVLIS